VVFIPEDFMKLILEFMPNKIILYDVYGVSKDKNHHKKYKPNGLVIKMI
jgi:hypothetical protein